MNRLLAVVGIVCGIIAFVLAAFATTRLDLAVEFAGAGVVAVGVAMIL